MTGDRDTGNEWDTGHERDTEGQRVNGDHCQDEIQDALAQGRPLSAQAQAHLQGCPGCQAEWASLGDLQALLLRQAADPEVTPPPAVRAELLRRIGQTGQLSRTPQVAPAHLPVVRAGRRAGERRGPLPRLNFFRSPRLALGAAAVLAALTLGAALLGSVLLTPPVLARALPDPAVVVDAGASLLVASNGAVADGAPSGGAVPVGVGPGTASAPLPPTSSARLTLITGERVTATLDVQSPHPAWFTEGVRQGDLVYLADCANDRVLVVQTRPFRVVRSIAVSGGVAGLSAGGGRVYYKSVRGQVGTLPTGQDPGKIAVLAQENAVPMADVMDAVLLQGEALYVTHHLRGELFVLDPRTLAVRRRVALGGAPVALAGLRVGLLVLDVKGRLLRLDARGQVRQVWKLPGRPDKLVLNGSLAVVTDRAGGVTQLDLGSGAVTRVTLVHPMDLTLMGDGHLAVAQAQTGVALLGAGLKVMPGGEVR